MLLQMPRLEEPFTAEDQVAAILKIFHWTDAVKRSITVMKAVQMWYYGYPASEVRTGLSMLESMITTLRCEVSIAARRDVTS
jgi:hypothetical protein